MCADRHCTNSNKLRFIVIDKVTNVCDQVVSDDGAVFLQDLRDTSHYVQSELDALDHEQTAIDERASALEQELRDVMNSG